MANSKRFLNVGETLTARADQMKLDNGDLFEIVVTEEDGATQATTMGIGASKHGRVLVDAWHATTGRVPTKSDLALLNVLGRTVAPMIQVLLERTREQMDREMAEDGLPLTAPMLEPFAASVLMAYVGETMVNRMAMSAVNPVLLVLHDQLMPIVMDLGTEYGTRSAKAAMGKPLPEENTVGTNGGMVAVSPDELMDEKKVRLNMDIAKGLGMMAAGKTRGEA